METTQPRPAGGEINDVVEELHARLGPQIDEARERIRELDKTVSTFIRERPGTALLCACALGYVIGRIASR